MLVNTGPSSFSRKANTLISLKDAVVLWGLFRWDVGSQRRNGRFAREDGTASILAQLMD